MMNEKEFIKSQEECATMLGMSLGEYQEYCKNLKVPIDVHNDNSKDEGNTYKVLETLGIDSSMLKKGKD